VIVTFVPPVLTLSGDAKKASESAFSNATEFSRDAFSKLSSKATTPAEIPKAATRAAKKMRMMMLRVEEAIGFRSSDIERSESFHLRIYPGHIRETWVLVAGVARVSLEDETKV
jgi:hypothetical protein